LKNKQLEEIISYFINDCQISHEKIQKLIDSFDAADYNIKHRKATIQAIENLIQLIEEICFNKQRASYSGERKEKIISGIQRLSSQYPSLYSFYISIIQYHREFQALNANNLYMKNEINKSKQFCISLVTELLDPIVIDKSLENESAFYSKHFGKIALVTEKDKPFSQEKMKFIFNIDNQFNKEMTRFEPDDVYPLEVYARSLRLLNRATTSATAKSKKTFADYLEDTSPFPKNKIKPPFATNIIFADSKMNDILDHNEKGEERLSTNPTHPLIYDVDSFIFTDSRLLILTLIHDFQHQYNIHYNNGPETFAPIEITKRQLDSFCQFTDAMPDGDLKFFTQSIATIIEFLITHISPVLQTLDEISARLTLMFGQIYPEVLRVDINLAIESASTKYQLSDVVRSDVLAILKIFSNALMLNERAITHMAFALVKYTVEFADEELQKDNGIGELLDPQFINMFAQSSLSEDENWSENLRAIKDIEKAFSSIFLIHMERLINEFDLFQQYIKLGGQDACDLTIPIENINISLLMMAIILIDDVKFAKLLIQSGADYHSEMQFEKNNSMAAVKGRYEILLFLLKLNVDPIALDFKIKKTILMSIENGLNISLKDPLKLEKVKENYPSCIQVISQLLCYPESRMDIVFSAANKQFKFTQGLRQFQKMAAFFYLLQQSGMLRLNGEPIPKELAVLVAENTTNFIPHPIFKNCYRDIFVEIKKNNLLEPFLQQGITILYYEFDKFFTHKTTKLQNVLSKIGLKNKPVDRLPTSQHPDVFIQYYTPRTLFAGAQSLAAVTLAKRDMQSSKHKNDAKHRKKLIAKMKDEVIAKHDEGLTDAIMKALRELQIKELDSENYHRIATALTHVFVRQKLVPSHAQFFQAVKDDFNRLAAHEKTEVNAVKSKMK